MSALRAVQHARHVIQRKHRLDRQQLFDEAVALGEWGLFSKRQIASFTGLTEREVSGLIQKTDKTGGRLEPEAIEHIEKIILGDRTPDRVRTAAEAGCSTPMLVRLTGLPGTTLRRWVAGGAKRRSAA